jgi:hypothetical protein
MNNITIVIQGQTNFYKEIIKQISPNFHYIWSTWENEPKENLKAIEDSMELVLSTQPNSAGNANVNYQLLSSFKGMEKVKTEYAFKTRGDMIIYNFDALLEKIMKNNKELSFFYYSLEASQIADFFSFGTTKNQLLLWDGQEEINGQSPEKTIQQNYMKNNGYKESFEDFIQRFYFFLPEFGENGIDGVWLKWPKCKISHWNDYENLLPKRSDYPHRRWPCEAPYI